MDRSSVSLWRLLAVIIGANVLLVIFGFLVPAGDDQINIAAVQHLLRSEGLIEQRRRRTVVYVRTEEPLSPEARESLEAYASYGYVDLRWLGDEARMALAAERNLYDGGYIFSLSAPSHGVIFSSIDAETHESSGSGSSRLVFYHWMGVSGIWQEREVQ